MYLFRFIYYGDYYLMKKACLITAILYTLAFRAQSSEMCHSNLGPDIIDCYKNKKTKDKKKICSDFNKIRKVSQNEPKNVINFISIVCLNYDTYK